LVGLLLTLTGRQFVKAIWFELAFLLFMIPIPYVLYYTATFPMQLLASKVTVGILHLLGMGVVRQGNIIHISGYSLEVAEACSGMRSMMSLLALGALFAYMTQPRLAGKILLFLSTIPLAILANVVRVFATTVMASIVGGLVTEEPLHSIFGASVFVVAFVGLFLTGKILARVFR
jgi:exosortase